MIIKTIPASDTVLQMMKDGKFDELITMCNDSKDSIEIEEV